MTRQFPSGRLVVATLVISVLVGGFMIFGTLARVSQFAEGLDPFDLRPRGYSIGEARALIALLGEEGRRYYGAGMHQWVANIYPVTFVISRALLLWWLTAPGRLRQEPIPILWRCALVLLPAVEAVPDYLENLRITEMLDAGSNVSDDLVASASVATQAKIVLTAVTDFTALALGLIVLWRRSNARAAM